LWNIGCLIPSSGRLFEWFRTLSGQEARPYRELLAELIPQPQGVPQAGACFFPKEGALPGLFLSLGEGGLPSRRELGRAVLDAMGFQVRGALSTLERQGFVIRELRVCGGQAKNPLWNQLKADLCGCSLLVPELYDGELAGDAAVAAVALGEHVGLAEAVSRMIRMSARYVPAAQTRDQYTGYYQAYRALQDRMREALTGGHHGAL
jgi:xylulokinase